MGARQRATEQRFRLFVLAAAEQPAALDKFDIQQHVFGTRRLGRPVGRIQQSRGLVGAVQNRGRLPLKHQLSRGQRRIPRRLRHGVGQLRQRHFGSSAAEQDFGAEQAELPLEEEIVACGGNRQAVFGGGFRLGQFSGLQIGARAGKQPRQVLRGSRTGNQPEDRRHGQALKKERAGHGGAARRPARLGCRAGPGRPARTGPEGAPSVAPLHKLVSWQTRAEHQTGGK